MEGSAAAAAPTWPTVAIVNDPSSGVADAVAQQIAHALEVQVLRDFGPTWHAGAHFEFVGQSQKPLPGRWVLALLSTSDQAGALGYHDLTPDGLPLGKVFCATDRQYGENVSVTASHELLEMLADPWINLAAQTPDGKFYAWEVADAVEDDSLGYLIDGVLVSAFVTPAWFGSGAGELTFPAGRVTRPLELAKGGYISVFDPSSGQGWQQQTAQLHVPESDRFAATLAAMMKVDTADALEVFKSRPRVGSRRERRFRGRQWWVASTFEQEYAAS